MSPTGCQGHPGLPVNYSRSGTYYVSAERHHGSGSPNCDDHDRFVRYYTAQELYGVLPQQCRSIIEENIREFDAVAGDARGFLRAIDEGTYKPR